MVDNLRSNIKFWAIQCTGFAIAFGLGCYIFLVLKKTDPSSLVCVYAMGICLGGLFTRLACMVLEKESEK